MNQGEVLRAAQKKLALSREELAKKLGVKRRTFDNWCSSPETESFRNMPDACRVALHQLLKESSRTHGRQVNWGDQCYDLIAAADARDYVKIDWAFAKDLAHDRLSELENVVTLYAFPIAAALSSPGYKDIAIALEPLAKRLAEIVAANPKVLGTKVNEVKALSGLPRRNNRTWKSLDSLLTAFREQISQ